jgi:hypothetical protein
MRIIATTTVPLADVLKRLPALGASELFVKEMAPALWQAGTRLLIFPPALLAQSIKETAWGTYPKNVPEWFRNTCGLKVPNPDKVMALTGSANEDQALVHHQFGNWDEAATAHAQHVRAYASAPVVGELIVDPRYQLVLGLRRGLTDWEQFGNGNWAKAADYGTSLVGIANKLMGA